MRLRIVIFPLMALFVCAVVYADIDLIDKIAPKNDGFTGMVDADQVLGGGDSGTLPDACVAESNVTQHQGAIKLDDLGTPDNNTDLDFSTSLHGLVPKGTDVGDFLKDDGSWDTPAGGGDVTGPGSATDSAVVLFDGAGGKTLKNSNITIDGTGLGINEASPETSIEVTSTTPYMTLHNSTEEDGDGGRESKILFKGEQTGTEETTLAEIRASHDGTGDDEKGDLIFYTNDGDDGDSPTERMRIDSDGILRIEGGALWTIRDQLIWRMQPETAGGRVYMSFYDEAQQMVYLGHHGSGDGVDPTHSHLSLYTTKSDGSTNQKRIDISSDLDVAIWGAVYSRYCFADDTFRGYPADSMQNFSGTHDSGNGEATLSDSTATWIVDELIGSIVTNTTDESSCTVTDNDETTVTCVLAGGTNDDWDTTDTYTVKGTMADVDFWVYNDGETLFETEIVKILATDPEIRLYDTDGTATYSTMNSRSGIGADALYFDIYADDGQAALVSFNPQVDDGTSACEFRFFRNTDTSGTRQLVLYKGDNSNSEMHTFRVDGMSIFNVGKLSTLDVQFRGDNDDDVLRIDASADAVCVGCAAPAVRLEVVHTTAPQFRVTHTAGADYIDFSVDGDGYATIDASGDILNLPDVVTLGDGSALATDAAPVADADIANKKYVDTVGGGGGGGDVTAAANMSAGTILVGDDGAKGIKDTTIAVANDHDVSNMGTLACETIGSGTISITGDLNVTDANPAITITDSDEAGSGFITVTGAESALVMKIGTTAANGQFAYLNLDANCFDDETATIRVFRGTTTTGAKTMKFYEDSAEVHIINVKGMSIFNVNKATNNDVQYRGDTVTNMLRINAGNDCVGIGMDCGGGKVLDIAGNIEATGTITANCGLSCDYIFDDDYELPSLNEVAEHIKEYGHLPGMTQLVGPEEESTGQVDLTLAIRELIIKTEEQQLYILGLETRLIKLEASGAISMN